MDTSVDRGCGLHFVHIDADRKVWVLGANPAYLVGKHVYSAWK